MPPGSKLTTQFIHCRSLPTYLCPVLCLTLRPSRSTSRYTAEGLLHTFPHTHSHTHTRNQIHGYCELGIFLCHFVFFLPFVHASVSSPPSHLPFYLSPTFVFAAFSITNVFRRARLVVAAVSVVCVVVAVFVVCFPPKRYKIVASCIIYCNCRGKNSCFCDTFGGIWSEKSVSRRRSENFQLHFSFFSGQSLCFSTVPSRLNGFRSSKMP